MGRLRQYRYHRFPLVPVTFLSCARMSSISERCFFSNFWNCLYHDESLVGSRRNGPGHRRRTKNRQTYLVYSNAMFRWFRLLEACRVMCTDLLSNVLGLLRSAGVQSESCIHSRSGGSSRFVCTLVLLRIRRREFVTHLGIGMRIVRSSTRCGTTPGILASYNAVSTSFRVY